MRIIKGLMFLSLGTVQDAESDFQIEVDDDATEHDIKLEIENKIDDFRMERFYSGYEIESDEIIEEE